MKIMPTLVFAMLSVAATPGAVQTKYDTVAGETLIAAGDPAPHFGVVVADRSNGAAPAPAPAMQGKYDPGASSTEIKIGNIMPYSGPAAAYGLIGKTVAAYFKKINAEGGINGRKINFISYDDGYNPQKAVEAARKLVEDDRVLSCFKVSERRRIPRSRNT
jgi:ABC-type branched-subunit amino acid transport system substrate-binding protein